MRNPSPESLIRGVSGKPGSADVLVLLGPAASKRAIGTATSAAGTRSSPPRARSPPKAQLRSACVSLWSTETRVSDGVDLAERGPMVPCRKQAPLAVSLYRTPTAYRLRGRIIAGRHPLFTYILRPEGTIGEQDSVCFSQNRYWKVPVPSRAHAWLEIACQLAKTAEYE
jgi:hypothetical protein